MALINLKTDLKSLKFGRDRPGGGSSNQPYIKSKIPNQDSDQSSILNTGGPDSLLRGGILAPIRAAEDTSRLTQMFFDLRSPTGLLFTAKQNTLSRLSVHTEASSGPGYGAGKVNQGIYTPLSTIGQAGVGITGTHLNTFGLDPSSPMTGVVQGGLFPGLGLQRYESRVKLNEAEFENRLEQLLFANTLGTDLLGNSGEIFNLGNSIIEYTGGPGSVLGVGKTRIRYADQRTGKNNLRAKNESNYFFSGSISQFKNPTGDFILPLGKTNYGELLGSSLLEPSIILLDDISKEGGITWERTTSNNVYTPGSLDSDTKVTGTTTWTQQDIIGVKNNRVKGQIQDFREILTAPTDKKVLGKLAKGYTDKIQMKDRVLSGDPGSTIGKDGKPRNVTKYGASYKGAPLDKITASPISPLQQSGDHATYNDLCKFSIGVIKNGTSGNANFMHFRAFIDGFSDSYTADWGDTQYVGRADKFYNYKGFGRNVSLSFTVAAQSKAELIPMYKKLNYLASSLAPSYSQGGFMQGNLIRLTIGGYLYNQVGILKGITYTIPQSSPWEIGLDDKVANDNSVKELPHMIQVTGFEFIPIQDFVPQVGNYQNQVKTRFISLANGSGEGNNNYNNSWKDTQIFKS